MQEAGSATKNREDKYQFDNVERERERERVVEKRDTERKKGKKDVPCAARSTPAVLGKTERNASGGEKTKRKKRTK